MKHEKLSYKINYIISFIGIVVFFIMSIVRFLNRDLTPFNDGELIILMLGLNMLFSNLITKGKGI